MTYGINIDYHIKESLRLFKYVNGIRRDSASIFEKYDVRENYWCMCTSIIQLYFFSFGHMKYFHTALPHLDRSKDPNLYFIENLSPLNPGNLLTLYSYEARMKNDLILNIFVATESSIDVIYRETLTDETIRKNESSRIDYLKTIFDFNTLYKKQIRALENRFFNSHIPFMRKIQDIYKSIEHRYEGNWKDDKEFLNFFSCLRNSVHNNMVSNSDLVFKLKEYEFIFSKGEGVRGLTFDACLAIVVRLFEILHVFLNNVEYDGLLMDPSCLGHESLLED